MRRTLLVLALPLFLIACGGGGGGGDDDVIVVTTLDDAGDGSLRAALAIVPADGTIVFEEGLEGTITLTSGPLSVVRNVIIQGPGAARIAVSGDNSVRVFDLELDLAVAITDLTIRDGSANSGGGMRAPRTQLLLRRVVFDNCLSTNFGRGGGLHALECVATLEDCTFTNCRAFNGGGFQFDQGINTMRRCTIKGCSTTGNAGGGGAMSSGGELHCLNCTFSGNHATGSDSNAGGFSLASSSAGGPTSATMTACTFTLNSATGGGGGIATFEGTEDDPDTGDPVAVPVLLTIKNSIVAANTAAGGAPDIDNGGSIISNGYNVIGIGEGSGLFDGVNNDVVGSLSTPLDPGLLPLAQNGGDTETHLPTSTSPAVDLVPIADFTNRLGQPVNNDQRGVLRPFGGACDAGSVERD